MGTQFVGANAVIVASHFNPSVISQLWLVRQGLVRESDFEANCIFSELLAQVRTTSFQMVVVPEQLQFSPSDAGEEGYRTVNEKLGAIVRLLPHTPFRAAGLNFVWHVLPDGIGVAEFSRRLFFREDVDLFRHFSAETSQFGSYLSKDFRESHLRLDIKPIVAQETGENPLQFSFNYHRDVSGSEEPVLLIRSLLGRWREAKQEALDIMDSLPAEVRDVG